MGCHLFGVVAYACVGLLPSNAHHFLAPLSPLTVACTLNGTRSAFTAAMHIALGDACPLDVLRVDEGGWLRVEVMRCCLLLT